jgi:cell cycle arrest protein BUB3
MTLPEIYISNPPTDGITNLEFSPKQDLLAASSWAKTLSIYDPINNKKLDTFTDEAAILDFKYSPSGDKLNHGGLSLSVVQTDIQTGQILKLGKHTEGVKAISIHENRVFSGSWDKTVRAWDSRSTDSDTISLNDKVFSMDILQNTLVIALANREILIYDTRSLKHAVQKRSSSLKYMIRKVKITGDCSGYCTSSIEGRVCVEYFTPDIQKFSFKCHRQKVLF